MQKVPSPWIRGAWLWVLTNGIGTMMSALSYATLATPVDSTFALAVGACSSVFSLLTIPIMVVVLDRILYFPLRQDRLFFVPVAVLGLWLVPFVAVMSIFGSYELLGEASWLAAPYYIAALAGTSIIYRRWLFVANA